MGKLVLKNKKDWLGRSSAIGLFIYSFYILNNSKGTLDFLMGVGVMLLALRLFFATGKPKN